VRWSPGAKRIEFTLRWSNDVVGSTLLVCMFLLDAAFSGPSRLKSNLQARWWLFVEEQMRRIEVRERICEFDELCRAWRKCSSR
jgi:hypothetical protein